RAATTPACGRACCRRCSPGWARGSDPRAFSPEIRRTADRAGADTAGVLEFVRDVTVADWVAGRLAHREACTLGMVVPRGYEAYARILHPPSLPDGTPT